MESRQSSFSRVSSFNVGQLDKINAIPNKTTDNALMSGLCSEDQLYLNALIEDDLPEIGPEGPLSSHSSAWSPMAQSPTMMKRIKKLRPSYAITLSLEEISYIRPSWGISKGIRTIEFNKSPVTKRKKAEVERKAIKESEKEKSRRTLGYLLTLLTLAVLFLLIPPYIIDSRRAYNKVQTNRVKVVIKSRLIEIYKPVESEHQLNPIFKVQFGQGIPIDLRPDELTCDLFEGELSKRTKNLTEAGDDPTLCFTSLDWPMRANMRLRVLKKNSSDEDGGICYIIKWQSYDSLTTPLIDCFVMDDSEQWLGLGDIQSPVWPINKIRSDWTVLNSNLSTEFPRAVEQYDMGNLSNNSHPSILPLGSRASVSLLSTNGIHVSNVHTDFDVALKIHQDHRSGMKRICLMAACNERCTPTWTRDDHLENFRHENNIFQYNICSGNNPRLLIGREIDRLTKELATDSYVPQIPSDIIVNRSISPATSKIFLSLSEVETKSASKLVNDSSRPNLEPVATTAPAASDQKDLHVHRHQHPVDRPDGIGLIERTIFATSQEFMPVLDGQTLRQYVDIIVKLGLKTSSILLIDNRWEDHAGSLKLNLALFPKAKLLFEILHNKGFKIVLTVKPYIDTGIGVSNVNLLFEAGRLYAASYESSNLKVRYKKTMAEKLQLSNSITRSEIILRRNSFISFKNETISIKVINNSTSVPYLFRCKESLEGYCALIDLTLAKNRLWFADNIRKSNLLTSGADGILFGGSHPISFIWDDHYRLSASRLVKELFYIEKLYVLPQWTGDFGYIQLTPRPFTWDALRSILGSTLNLGAMGYSLINPGSVWGDLKGVRAKVPNKMETIYGDSQSASKIEEELSIRWLQVAIFLPVLQFNDISPVERYGLHELLQNSIKTRKLFIVSEMKKYLPFTPLITGSQLSKEPTAKQLPLIRPVWFSQDSGETMIEGQFMVGPDILVAPILHENLRQRDIYLPSGFWHDELRQVNLRGGKWLRNYPVELHEVAWFTRMRR